MCAVILITIASGPEPVPNTEFVPKLTSFKTPLVVIVLVKVPDRHPSPSCPGVLPAPTENATAKSTNSFLPGTLSSIVQFLFAPFEVARETISASPLNVMQIEPNHY